MTKLAIGCDVSDVKLEQAFSILRTIAWAELENNTDYEELLIKFFEPHCTVAGSVRMTYSETDHFVSDEIAHNYEFFNMIRQYISQTMFIYNGYVIDELFHETRRFLKNNGIEKIGSITTDLLLLFKLQVLR